MDARMIRFAMATVLLAGYCHSLSAQLYQVDTQNFSIFAPDRPLAQKAGKLAEEYRKSIAIDWLGYELEPWRERCPVTIRIDRHAGGETSFGFVGGSSDGSVKATPIGWQMKIFGPPDRVLDSVLPHEITHTVFATYFGRPLPRWADEGACTTVEHVAEKAKNHEILMESLRAKPSRGIPFNRMFTMKQYPDDMLGMLALYAQGHSVAKYLIYQKGKRHFIDFVEAGLNLEYPRATTAGWDRVTREFYGYENLSELQIAWLGWVKQGSPQNIEGRSAVASLPKRSDSIIQFAEANPQSWYAQQMVKRDPNSTFAISRQAPAQSTTSTPQPFEPGSVSIPTFRDPQIPQRQRSTMSAKGTNTLWR